MTQEEPAKSSKRRALVGRRYVVCPAITAEIRKSCRDEWKIIYEGGPFGPALWEQLKSLGRTTVLEASRLNPKMKDLWRIFGESVRVEGAMNGELLLAFYAQKGRSPARHRVENLLRAAFG